MKNKKGNGELITNLLLLLLTLGAVVIIWIVTNDTAQAPLQFEDYCNAHYGKESFFIRNGNLQEKLPYEVKGCGFIDEQNNLIIKYFSVDQFKEWEKVQNYTK